MERATFRDEYRAPLSQPSLTATELFEAIFAHRPAWMNLILIARNRAARLAGLDVPTDHEIWSFEKKTHYVVGEKIGPWPIYFLSNEELIAGRDNRHLDFRLSIRKVRESVGQSVIVSTTCFVHNKFGRIYLTAIIPFHKFGVRKLIKNAIDAGRI